MIIDQLPEIPLPVDDADELAIERGKQTFKVAWSGLAGSDISSIKSEIATYVRPNLIENWYFAGGGSQKGAGYFPINQRGQTSYNSGACIDRWYADNSLTIYDEYISTNNSVIYQPCGKPFIDNLLGKTLTASLLYANGELYYGTLTLPAEIPASTTIYTFEQNHGIGLAIYSGAGGGQSFRFAGNQAVAVKLEIGDTQTLAHQENGVWVLNEIPNYFVERVKYNAPGTVTEEDISSLLTPASGVTIVTARMAYNDYGVTLRLQFHVTSAKQNSDELLRGIPIPPLEVYHTVAVGTLGSLVMLIFYEAGVLQAGAGGVPVQDWISCTISYNR